MKFKERILILSFLIGAIVQAGTVSDLIDYQLYKDFAMNKGRFQVGATDIKIERKDGSYKTINVPILDFAATDNSGIGTLIDPSYIGGVQHNRGYTAVTYGRGAGHTYKLVDRNDKGLLHTPRLAKLVTEVASTNVAEGDLSKLKRKDFLDRYSVLARVGSGAQFIQGENGKTFVTGAYQFLTGGLIDPNQISGTYTWSQGNTDLIINGRDNAFSGTLDGSALPIYIESGDSGSPLWGFNKHTKQWELIGFTQSTSGKNSLFTLVNNDIIDKAIAEDTLFFTSKGGEEIVWGKTENYDTKNPNRGSGIISQGDDNTLKYTGLNPDLHIKDAVGDALNHGKHIVFSGEDGTIKLEDHVNQGAGKIWFRGNYTVTSENKDKTWVGAGLQIDKDKTVLWQVNGVEGDDLHKIGEGTLHVNGVGVNEGGLNVGDGLVILDQEADAAGKVQAFNNIDIVSGRATVRLTDDKQVDTSKIRFGFRGGRLDLYGNNITFGDINASDSGAMIVNGNNDKKAVANINTDKFTGKTSIFHGYFGETDKDRVNGELDVNIGGTSNTEKIFAITGGTNLNGDINLTSGNTTLVLSGARALHAGEKIKNTQLKGDYYFSEFNFKNLNMSNGSDFYGGVYSSINGDINAQGNNKLILGYIAGESKYVYDETQETWDRTAVEKIMTDENTDGKFNTITTLYNGDINLKNNSSLKVGYTDIKGNINVSGNSTVGINNSVMTGNINSDFNSHVFINNSTLITNNSNIGNLSVKNTQLVFDDSIDGNGSTFETASGDTEALFKVNFDNIPKHTTSYSPLLTIGGIGNNGFNLNFNVINTGKDSAYGKMKTVVALDNLTKDEYARLKLSTNGYTFDFGALRGKVEVISTANKNRDELINGELVIKVPDASVGMTKYSASDMGNAGLSNFTAKTSVVKSQKLLLEDSLSHMGKDRFTSGIEYKGNYSDAKYESDKFREFSQSIINHGVGIEDVSYISNKWSLYKGLAFLYGKSNTDFDGDYSGEIETYSANVYGKLLNENGVYIKGLFGVNYLEASVNDSKENSYSTTLGTGVGIEKNYAGLKLEAETNLNLFYFEKDNYILKDKSPREHRVDTKESYVIEINPEVKVSKNFNFGNNNNLSVYAGAGYEYNFYLNNDGAEITVDGVNGRTGVIENGASIKTGLELQVKNVTLGAEAKLLEGSDNSEKITGSLKAKIKF